MKASLREALKPFTIDRLPERLKVCTLMYSIKRVYESFDQYIRVVTGKTFLWATD